jgi:hypothetical protein
LIKFIFGLTACNMSHTHNLHITDSEALFISFFFKYTVSTFDCKKKILVYIQI